MQIRYSPEADVLPVRIIVHYSSKNEPLEIEILDASKVVQLSDVDVSLKELLTHPA